MRRRRTRHRVAIYGRSPQEMLALVHDHEVEVLDHGSRRLEEGLFRAYAILDAEQTTKVEAAGYKVERLEDVDETAKARRAEVGTGDRFRPPSGG